MKDRVDKCNLEIKELSLKVEEIDGEKKKLG